MLCAVQMLLTQSSNLASFVVTTATKSKKRTKPTPVYSLSQAKKQRERIVRFVAKKSHDVPIEEIEAVPPILSLLCRELNECRFTKPLGLS